MITKGTKISNRYEIIKSIGEGGMANVFLALDTILNREVAVKVLRGDFSEDEKFIRRFQREALSASGLCHPNIVEIYDVGEDNGIYFIVMEYVDGKTLKQLVKKRGALTLAETIDIMTQLTDGIKQAHQSYIIHRDIKPQNVMIKENGEIKITDFGIAVSLNNTQLTQTKSVMGSVHYLPPEQATGKGATVKTDIYELGITMYELLTGSLPFKGDNAVEIALKHIKDDIPRVTKINSMIPQSVENIILKCCAKNPKNRYATVEEMNEDLKTCLQPERAHDEKVVYKFPEHSSEIKKENLKIDENDKVKVKEKKLDLDDEDDGKKSNVVIWILSIIFFLLILGIVVALLYINNDQVKDVSVPDVTKLTSDAAIKMIEEAGLKVNSTIENFGSEEIDAGLVVKTYPTIGKTVKEGTVITIYVSSGKIKYTVENLVGKNAQDVQKILKNNYEINVVIEKKSVEDTSKEYKEGIIFEQDVEVGTLLGKGANITVYVPEKIVVYPDFTDGSYNQDSIDAWCKEKGAICRFETVSSTACSRKGQVLEQAKIKGTPVIDGYENVIKICGDVIVTPGE